MTKLLMVCMNNICRSPMAQVVAHKLALATTQSNQFFIDSAGTSAPDQAQRPDPRTQAMLLHHGYNVSRSRSRRIGLKDFQRFDLILAMDCQNLAQLNHLCPPEHSHKLHLLMDFSHASEGREIPDPYYGNAEGFERVLLLCETGARGLLQHLLG